MDLIVSIPLADAMSQGIKLKEGDVVQTNFGPYRFIRILNKKKLVVLTNIGNIGLDMCEIKVKVKFIELACD